MSRAHRRTAGQIATLLGALALIAAIPSEVAAQACAVTAPLPAVRSGPAPVSFGLLPLTPAQSCPTEATSLPVSSSAPWLHTSSASVSMGRGSVGFFVDANNTNAPRSAVISVANVPLITYTQDTAACVAAVTPVSHTFPATGGSLQFQVQTTTADCFWTVDGFPGPPPFFNPLGPGWLVPTGTNSYGQPRSHLMTSDVGTRTFDVVASSNAFNSTSRSTMLFFGGGPTANISQAAPTCQFTFSPSSVNIPANGGSATVDLTGIGSDCSYASAVTIGASYISITAGGSGTAPAAMTITVAANTETVERTGQVIAVNGVLVITQAGPPIAVDFGGHAHFGGIGFGAMRTSNGSIRVTAAEIVRLTNTVEPNATWNATASQPWIALSATSGITPASLRISLDSAALAVQTPAVLAGTVDIVSSTAPQTPRRILITVYFYNGIPRSQEHYIFGLPPLGFVDTPGEGATGLSGAVPITGWAIDRVGLNAVRIYRGSVAGEPQGLVYIGDAVRVFGARPDLLPFYSFMPEARLGGWGYMLLSNVLPNRGNGPFTFSVYAEDFEGNNALIGTRTVTFDNAAATRPFGTIDTPAQGQTVSGTIVNGGWVLTPQTKTIPVDGSTINVYIDGVLLGPVTQYNVPRPDVKQYFPGLNNSDGPEARLSIDTTTLSDGVHTIAWAVADHEGAAEGIGSRFFTVQNGASSLVWAPEDASRSATTVARLPLLRTDVWSREGIDEQGWATRVDVDRKGNRTLRVRHGQRVELFLGPTLAAACGIYEGHLLNGDVAGPLPPGAFLESRTGIFRWQPTVAFSGRFDFVFVQRGCDAVERRIPLTVVIDPHRRP